MKSGKNHLLFGFTIVEVVLVLAISGLMALSAILGVQGSINNQRYNDSVNSFRDFLRNQYNSIVNTDISSRNSVVENYCGNTIQRGRTNCLVLGRLLKFENDKVQVYDVIGNEEKRDTEVHNDEEYFKSNIVNLRAVGEVDFTGGDKNNPKPKEEYRLDWDAKIKKPDGNSTPSKYVLIVRSPVSGSIRTYAMESESKPGRTGLDQVLTDLVNPLDKPSISPLDYQSEFCVHPEGITFTNKRAVIIKPNGSNASAVEIAPLDSEINGVKPIKCN